MNKVHFVGIGGIGMSALADLLIGEGVSVSGSDIRPNKLTDRLKRRGARIYKGHDAGNVGEEIDLIVKSSCIKETNPEVVKGRAMGVRIINRGELLKTLMDSMPVAVAVTGTHGKTTTSALISHIAEVSGKRPTSVIGGEVEHMGGNAKKGGGTLIVAEVDESDGYFRNINSTCGVITNIEREHMDNYGSMEALIGAYRSFISRISPAGVLLYNREDSLLSSLAGETAAKKVSFGITGGADITCNACSSDRSIEFDLYISGQYNGKVRSSLVGRHNIMNILAAVGAGLELGADIDSIKQAVLSFRGVCRRFDKAGSIGAVEVIEDYAHHPTEIAAVIKAAKAYSRGRVVVVFQPHRHSRTNDLAHEFMRCFAGADVLVLTEVYSADEECSCGVGIEDIYRDMDKRPFEDVVFLGKERIAGYVAGISRADDTVLVLGAGDIRSVCGEILEKIKNRQ